MEEHLLLLKLHECLTEGVDDQLVKLVFTDNGAGAKLSNKFRAGVSVLQRRKSTPLKRRWLALKVVVFGLSWKRLAQIVPLTTRLAFHVLAAGHCLNI